MATSPEREPEPERERDADDGKSTGVALRWNSNGFGFIKPDDGGEDLFCHVSAIEDGNCLVEGAKVSFIKGQDERSGRDRAQNVTGGSTEEPGGPGGPQGDPGPAPEGHSTGVALRWNPRGFGFIKPDDGSVPRPVSFISREGGVAQWQSVRFACGKPRVQTPAPPPTHI